MLLQLAEAVRRGRPALKMDKRMTGSVIIDEVIQEVNIVLDQAMVMVAIFT